MKTVTVNASRSYDVIIGSGLLTQAGSLIQSIHKPCRAAIISDSNVFPLYGEKLSQSLSDSGFSALSYVFPAGEGSKNMETFSGIVNFLAENKLTRSDLLIALGGGVVGDITGFAAACYLRGITFVQIPTSLLAMVDSSVGGKTAIDLPAGKNLVGAFYQPSLVICDTDTLSTLPEEIFRDGCAEVIKYSVLFDKDMFAKLQNEGVSFHRQDVICRCVELKRDVVQEDEFDTGRRQLLNLGHTLGHAIEKLSNLTVSHGQAVAAGMAIIIRCAEAAGICATGTGGSVASVLNLFGLPTATTFTEQSLYDAMLSDKKRFGGTVNLIVPEGIGMCILRPTDVTELKSFIKAGL